jgi:hypothetical protein
MHPCLHAMVSDKGIFGLVSHEESELYMSLVVRKASIDHGLDIVFLTTCSS